MIYPIDLDYMYKEFDKFYMRNGYQLILPSGSLASI